MNQQPGIPEANASLMIAMLQNEIEQKIIPVQRLCNELSMAEDLYLRAKVEYDTANAGLENLKECLANIIALRDGTTYSGNGMLVNSHIEPKKKRDKPRIEWQPIITAALQNVDHFVTENHLIQIIVQQNPEIINAARYAYQAIWTVKNSIAMRKGSSYLAIYKNKIGLRKWTNKPGTQPLPAYLKSFMYGSTN